MSLTDIASALRALESALICSHISPDPDAVGSSCGLALLLGSLGKTAEVYLQDPLPTRMRDLLGGIHIQSAVPTRGYSAVIVIDTASKSRIGKSAEQVLKCAPQVIVLDHHISNEGFGDLNYVDASVASSAEIVFALAGKLGVQLTKLAADLLFAGLVDDTGSFRFSNTKAATFRAAEGLVSLGAEPERIANLLYFSTPRRLVALRALVTGGLRMMEGGKIALVVVTQEMLKKSGCEVQDTEGLVDEARAIEGTLGAVLLREIENGWKVSLRSKSSAFDVNRVAGAFGGGGHVAAAGCTLRGELAGVEAKLFEQIREALPG